MGLLARRNLFHDKIRFAVTLTGIVFALALIIVQFGLFLGSTSHSRSQRFPGYIVRVGRILGRRNVRTDEPSGHVDTKILETLVELEPGH